MNRALLLFFRTGLLLPAQAQQSPTATLTGRVYDAKTGQPLPFATVFLNNTARGTTADSTGTYRLTGVPLGTHELIASQLGYAPARQPLRLTQARAYPVDLRPEPTGSDLAAVTVKARRSGAWLRQFRQFSRELLGQHPFALQTRIINPQGLGFTEERGHLLAQAAEPLVIENQALGYRLHYTLLHFDLYRGRLLFAGDCQFEELSPRNNRQRASWLAARHRAYRSSLHHLLASLLTGTHEAEGFTVYQTPLLLGGGTSPDAQALPLVRTDRRQRLTPQGAMDLFRPGEVAFERRLLSPHPLEVYDDRVSAYNSPYQDSPAAYSMLLLPQGEVVVTLDGGVTRGRGLDVRGYLGGDRLATLLPTDWVPSEGRELDAEAVASGRTLRPDAGLDSLQARHQRQANAVAPVVFVHTDKTRYATGDRLWLSAYVLNPANQLPLTGPVTRPLHVEVLTPEGWRVTHQWLRLENGRAAGSLRLSDTLAAGTYRLRAYTDGDQEATGPAFETTLTVQNGRLPAGAAASAAASLRQGTAALATLQADSLDVQFLPEGGRWLVGVPTRLGVRAVQPGGRDRAVGGVIADGAGREVGRFATDAWGLGRVLLTALPGQRYTARLKAAGGSLPQTVPLPAPEAEGWTLSADADSTGLTVTAWATGRYAEQPVYVTLQSRQRLVYRQKWQLGRGEARFVLPTSSLPAGVARLTLWDAGGQPRAERLVFVPERDGGVQVRPVLAKAHFAPREGMAIGLLFRDAENYPVGALWSASVTDADQVPADSTQADIRTHLLLTSALRGRIEMAGRYLEPGRQTELDNLLLTHGWRRLPAPTPADSLGGWALSGWVTDRRGQPLRHETVLLTLETGGLSAQRRLSSDERGAFRLGGLLLADTVRVRAALPGAKTGVVRFDPPGRIFPVEAALAPDWGSLAEWSQQVAHRQAAWPAQYRDTTARLLEEVIVRASRPRSEREPRPVEVERASLHSNPDQVIILEGNDAFADVKDMNDLFSRLHVMRSGRVGGAISFGDNQPLIIIDGVYIGDNKEDIYAKSALGGLQPSQINRIEFIYNAEASIYGARAAAGVIAIYTRRGKNEARPLASSPTVTLLGLATPREYYVPRYELPEEAAHPDRRDVLYWQPLGHTDANGQGRLLFPLSDMAKRLRVQIQGITTEGAPISYAWELPVR
jgi:hypothetical protein